MICQEINVEFSFYCLKSIQIQPLQSTGESTREKERESRKRERDRETEKEQEKQRARFHYD